MRSVALGSMVILLAIFGTAVFAGCHADPDDPKGQAKELEDPVRREYAVTNLQRILNNLLVQVKGDRSAKAFKAFADSTIDQLVKVYLDHPEDTQNGMKILNLLQELRDPRALPALLKALEWKAEVTEDQAVNAARTIVYTKIPADKRPAAVGAICKALERVTGPRGLDNRMRKAFIEALGELGDKGATSILTKVALAQSESQNFLFNILAAQQIVKIADPEAVPAMVKALYIFDPQKPAMRMNDVATGALVAIGRPALQPLLDVLKGENQEVVRIVDTYIEAIRHRDPEFAAKMKRDTLVSTEASYALGKLGYPEAIDALVEETKAEDDTRRFGAAIALVSINRGENDTPRIMEAMKDVYEAIEPIQQPQMLVALRHLYAEEVMPFFLNVLKTYKYKLSPIRLYAFLGYAMLGNKAEMESLKPFFEDEQFKQRMELNFPNFDEVLAQARECDANVDCWVGKLDHKDNLIVRKAANTVARFGRGNEKAIQGLVKHLAHSDLEVRNEVLSALDYVAVKGSQEAVDKIDDLETKEAGRSIWNNFKREALPTRSRLRARVGGA